MDQYTRRIIGFGVHTGDVDGIALCRMFNAAIYSEGVPEYPSSDNDPLFLYHKWQANLRILGTAEIKTVPYTPLSHPFVERLIETIRREFLDQTLFLNISDLERKLLIFASITTRTTCALCSMVIHPQKMPENPSSTTLTSNIIGGKLIAMGFSNYP